MDLSMDKKNEIVMKLLHYFITEQNYNPIILQGADNEIWLENLDKDYEIIRIVSNHVHNDEQLEYDTFKTRRVVKKIKRKTFTFDIKVLSIFTDLGENVHLEKEKGIDSVFLEEAEDIKKYKFVKEVFPDIGKKLKFTEEGVRLFVKITSDINKKNRQEADKANDIFMMKTPVVTYALIAINIIVFLLQYLHEDITLNYSVYNLGVIKYQEYYRIFTGMFLHAGIIHLAFNMYALYILGKQLESFLGKTKYILVYLGSGIFGSLMSLAINSGVVMGVGASGAIFGLIGSILCFGYYYRIYLGQVIRTQIMPLLFFNLAIGFAIPEIDVFAHIGGLVGGFLVTMALGVKYKDNLRDQINGVIIGTIVLIFLWYLMMQHSF
ncbi:MAG: rhomboid family intramembrane serine protease [Bacilli bacterium]|nr:rhomboid family intramembrane serine protease [Bacilli bacterium]